MMRTTIYERHNRNFLIPFSDKCRSAVFVANARNVYHALTALFFIFFLPCQAQESNIHFDRINLQNGLSQGSIHCILQDQKGFMWFGTQDGLNKYDGYQFTVYRHDHENAYSISDNWVNALYEDSQGYIWVGGFSGGLNRFDRRRERFVSYQYDPENPNSISANGISAICEDASGALWVGTTFGLNALRFEGDSLSVTHFFHDTSKSSSISHDYITSLYIDKRQDLWVGTKDGLNRWNPGLQSFERYYPAGLPRRNDITAMVEDPEGNLYVGTAGQGLFMLNRPNQTFIPLQFPTLTENNVSALACDPMGRLWVGYHEEGIIIWDAKISNYISIHTDPAKPRSLSNDLVYSLFFDRFGNLWAGTLDGLNKFNLTNRKFLFYQNLRGVPSHIHNSVFALYKDREGALWSGTREGLFYYDRSRNLRKHYKNDPTDVHSLKHDAIRAIFQDANDDLWVGSEAGMLIRKPHDKEEFEYFAISPELDRNPIYVITEDAHERYVFWLGTTNGLYRFNTVEKTARNYLLVPLARSSMGGNEIRSMAQDKDGGLWIASRGSGLFYFDRKTAQFRNYRHDPEDPESISANVIVSLHLENGVLWVGTASGFNKLDIATGKFKRYSRKHGLISEIIYGILPDDQGYLWLSSNNGLSRFDPVAETFRHYDPADGLQSAEFNAGGYYKSDDGELLFGGINGFNAFYPQNVVNDSTPPNVLLTGFRVFNEPVKLPSSPEYVREINLSYRDFIFSFEFTALHLTAPHKNKYLYMMEGFDRDWTSTSRRFATYTNLDPGSYTFRVKASNHDGVWNEEGLAINIAISPPFWRTWWFYALIFAAIATIIYSVYRFRISQIKRAEILKTEMNKKLAEVEMKALRAQMNPHFLFNCLNSINRYIVRSDAETASNYLTKFSRLIRLILQNSKTQTVTLENELEALRLYIELEGLRFENKFDYVLKVDPQIDASSMEIPPLLLQPYVENAIWHGLMHKEAKGKLDVKIKRANGSLVCVIEDNGIGRAKAMELKSKSAIKNKSMGMKITSDRLALVNQNYSSRMKLEIEDLIDEDGEPAGTRVTLGIPYFTNSAYHVVDQ